MRFLRPSPFRRRVIWYQDTRVSGGDEEMLCFLLLHVQPRFYRVEVAETLFGDYSVSREWGRCGKSGRQRMAWFSNLRDAVVAADCWQRQAARRGYRAEDIEGAVA